MHFSTEGPYDRVTRITGPHHNSLDLIVVQDAAPITPGLEELPQIGSCSHRALDKELVIRNVIEGVATANAKLGTSYSVQSIRIVPNDTPPEDIYRALAAILVEQHHEARKKAAQKT